MRSFPLTTSASTTLDGTGAGTVQLGPAAPREVWRGVVASVVCSAQVAMGTCQAVIYAGPQPQQSWFRDATFSGDTGDFTDAAAGDEIRPGSYVWAVFSGGVPGATATLTVRATKEVP